MAVYGSEMTPENIQQILDDSPAIELTITLKQANLNTAQLACWLYELLEIDPAMDAVRFDSRSTAALSAAAVKFLTGAAQLTHTLLHSAGIPLYQPLAVAEPELLADDRITVRVWVPTLAELPAIKFNYAFEQALQLCKRAQQLKADSAHRSALNQYLETQVLPKLGYGVLSGAATVPVLLAAQRAGIPFLHLGRSMYALGVGSAQRHLFNSVTDGDAVIGAKLAGDKATTASLLKKAGLPTPHHVVVSSYADALTAAQQIGWPVVVKPVDGERGEGVTVNVDGEPALKTAVELALKQSKLRSVIVEERIEGVCHRLYITNGALLYAVKRPAIDVTGNGVDSVATLARDAYNKERLRPSWKRQKRPTLDEAAIAHLRTLNLSPSYIPASGESVALRLIESTASGGGSIDVTPSVHPDNVTIALQAAIAIGLETVGVDIICEDISVPWHRGNALITELNFQPVFGSGEVSLVLIPKFLEDYLTDRGRIPLANFAADQSRAAAEQLAAWQASGRNAALLNIQSGELRWGDGRTVPPTLLRGRQQLRALLLDRRLDALAIVGAV